MSWLRKFLKRTDPVTFVSPDDNVLRLRVNTRTQTGEDVLKTLDKPTCQRINLAQWKIQRAIRGRRHARSIL